ncbi:hypothetical protein Syun_002225 [Stephania yunnanensis]|uniref:Uncharacterized protein n=1 Tax=Stephania yunnanensis TaxID=152371 RepID=A0AAP0LI85_9MAGN
MCEQCMKGKKRGGRGNEIKALHKSVMPFIQVHRGKARTDDVSVQAVYEGEGSTGAKLGPMVMVCVHQCMKRKERNGEIADEESHGGNEIDRDDNGNGSGNSDGDDDDIGEDDEVVVNKVWGWFT